MASIASILSRIDNALNPIVVKELRQIAKGQFLWTALIIFLAVQLFILWLGLLDLSRSTFSDIGKEIVLFLNGCLIFVSLFVIPVSNGFKLIKDGSDQSAELLSLTAMAPHSVIRGEFLAAMTMLVMFYSVCSPFITFAYFFRGIDINAIFLLLIFNFVLAAGAILLFILIANLSVSVHFKNILGAFGIWGLISLQGLVYELARDWIAYEQLDLSSSSPFVVFITVGTIVLFFEGIFYKTAIAAISLPGVDKALPVRKFIWTSWLISLPLIIAAKVHLDPKFSDIMVCIWGVFWQIIFSCGMVAAICEREAPSRAQLTTMSRNPVRRMIQILFGSGAATGVIWSALMAWLTYKLRINLTQTPDQMYGPPFHMIKLIPLYTLFYVISIYILQKSILHSIISRSYNWLLFILTAILMGIIHIALYSSSYAATPIYVQLFDPYLAVEYDNSNMVFNLLLPATILVLLISLYWFIPQLRKYRTDRFHICSNGSAVS